MQGCVAGCAGLPRAPAAAQDFPCCLAPRCSGTKHTPSAFFFFFFFLIKHLGVPSRFQMSRSHSAILPLVLMRCNFFGIKSKNSLYLYILKGTPGSITPGSHGDSDLTPTWVGHTELGSGWRSRQTRPWWTLGVESSEAGLLQDSPRPPGKCS